MKITSLSIDGFGQFHGTRIEPAPGLTVIRGVNEAGKSTLLAFVRATLFGFETGRYPALAGGRRGGWLDVEMRDGRRFRIERFGDRGGQGSLKVFDERDNNLGDGYLATLLQGVEKKVYQNIFAFGLEELTEFNRLTDEEVAARIYGAGAGTGSVSGLEVESTLQAQCEGLFKPGGHNPTINALLRQLEETTDLLRDRNLPAEYGEAGRRLDAVEANLRYIGERHAELGARRRARQRILDGWLAWLDLVQARSHRDTLGEVVVFAAATLERLGRLETAVESAAEALRQAELARERAATDLEAAALDEDALARRGELEALAEASTVQAARRDERARTERDLATAVARADDAIAQLGAGWTIERIEAFDDSIAVHGEIDGRFRTLLDRTAEAVAAARRDLAGVDGRVAEVAAQAGTLDARIAELDAALAGRPPHLERERRLRDVESVAGRLEQRRVAAADRPEREIPAERAALERRTHDARALAAAIDTVRSARDLLAGVAAPVATDAARSWQRWIGPVAVLVLGIALAVVVWVAGLPLVGTAIGIAAVLIAVAWILVARRPTPSPVEGIRRQLEAQVEDAAATIDRTGPAIGLGAAPTQDDVARIQATLDEERRALDREADRAERAEAAAREAAPLERQLADEAGALGLPAVPKRGDLEAVARQIAADRDAEARRGTLLEQQTQLRATNAGLVQRREELLTAAAERAAEEQAGRDEWRTWLEAHGIDPGVDRETASRIVDAVSAAKTAIAGLRALERRRDVLAGEDAAFAAQVETLGSLLPEGRFDGTDTGGAARLLARRLAAALDGERARAALEATLADRLAAVEAARAAADQATAELAAFLAGFGTADGDTLRAEVDRSGRAAALDEAIGAATRTLTTLSGPGEALAVFIDDLEATDDVDLVREEVDDLDAQLAALAAERDELNQEAGGLRNRRADMERDAAATELRQRRADLQAQLEAAAERWTVHALARELLARSRAAYEEAHRPAVVQAAERYFAEWTGGRYRRIVAPLGSSIESVERADGVRVALTNLSRGTSEQLYLALRFGLVERFVETSGEPLPIVMDDILVNFDDDRAARAARSIEALAGTCQVIYFTCHPTTPLDAEVERQLTPIEVG